MMSYDLTSRPVGDPYLHEKWLEKSLGAWLAARDWRAPVFGLSPGSKRTAFHDDYGDSELEAFEELRRVPGGEHAG